MSDTEIISALLALSPRKRAEIAGILLRSLTDEDVEEEVEKAWAKELERRVEEIRSGSVRAVPGDTAMKRLRRKVRRSRAPGRK